MTPSEVAIRAAQIISTQGLAKGQLANEAGEVCHNGAVFQAVSGSPLGTLSEKEQELANEVIGRSCLVLEKREGTPIAHVFSDDTSTSPEDVILLLKENAALDDDAQAMAVIQERRERGDYEKKALPDLTIFPPLFLPLLLPFKVNLITD